MRARHDAPRLGVIGAGLIIVVALLVGVVGYAAYQEEVRSIHAARFAELRLIGDLKTEQVLDWRNERLGDIAVGSAVAFGGVDLADFANDPSDAAVRAGFGRYMEAVRRNYDYADAILTAPDGRLLLSLDPVLAELDATTRQLIAQVAASREPTMGDFVRAESSGDVYIDVAAPILDPSGRSIAALLLRIDPTSYVFPLIQSWPTPSESSETLIVRRDGDDVLFLNILRHRSVPALTIREPLSRTDIPAVAAVLGSVGEVRGVDYRGVEVLADVRPIPGTAWFLVVKVDAAEVLAEIDQRGSTILLLGLLAVLLTGGAVGLLFSLRQSSLRGRLLHAERDKASAARLHERMLALARDSFLLLDASGRITDANEAAVAAYGYSREELLRLNIADLRAPESRAALDSDWQAAARAEGALFETTYLRPDGSTFPVEVSSRLIDLDGSEYRVSFARDITVRRATEAQLLRLSRAYATLAATNEAILRSPDESALFESICRIAVEDGGYVGAWVSIVDEPSRRTITVATAGTTDDYVRELMVSTDLAVAEDLGPTGLVLREGRAHYCDDCLGDAAPASWHDLARRSGIRAFAALPLLRGDAPVGVFSLFASKPRVFEAEMRTLLEQMAADVSFALDSFERLAARKRAEEALAAGNAGLAVQLDELRRWNDATLEREERILELKREINDLLASLGQPPRYPSAADDREGTAPDG